MARPKAIGPVKGQRARIRMVVVADAGWGKTVFSGTAPNALFLVCDPEGTISAAAFNSDADKWDIKNFSDLEAAYKWLRDEGCEEYEWCIVDTIGGAQRILQRSALDASYKANPAKQDPDVPSIAVHQKAQIQTIKFVMQFNDLPINMIYTAHPMQLEDGEGEEFILPYVHGGRGEIAQQTLGHMNVAGYGTTVEGSDGKEIRRMYFVHTGPFRGKDRFHKLGRYMDEPTVPKIMAKMTATTGTAAKKTAAKKTAARRTATAK
jgi:hypothetical protein